MVSRWGFGVRVRAGGTSERERLQDMAPVLLRTTWDGVPELQTGFTRSLRPWAGHDGQGTPERPQDDVKDQNQLLEQIVF